ncbi:hypothetical protein R3P38DRAFT_2811670 [Favolaschia claudopus]|uniref:Uncharacterized protein n=1 Tax=Favolaschia claudopus TaxID=2862362 RepID=A0AAV9Z8G5_9AGAR
MSWNDYDIVRDMSPALKYESSSKINTEKWFIGLFGPSGIRNQDCNCFGGRYSDFEALISWKQSLRYIPVTVPPYTVGTCNEAEPGTLSVTMAPQSSHPWDAGKKKAGQLSILENVVAMLCIVLRVTDSENFFRPKTRRWHDSTTLGASFLPNTASIELVLVLATKTENLRVLLLFSSYFAFLTWLVLRLVPLHRVYPLISRKLPHKKLLLMTTYMDLTLVGPSDQEEDDEPFYDPLFHQDDEDSSEDEEEEDGDEEEEEDGPVVVPAKRKRPSRAATEPPDVEPESREVVYTVSMFTAAQLKKPKSSRGPPMSDFFKLMSDADWPACKAQIRTILRTMLELEAVNLSNYDVTFTIPRHVKDPMTLQNSTQYEHLVSTALQIKASPAAKILIQPKLVSYCSLFRLVS